MNINSVALIGVGLIGGSICLDLQKVGVAKRIIGYDVNDANLEVALARKIITEKGNLESIATADLIIVAVPVDEAIKVLDALLPIIAQQTVVIDVGSTKHAVCEAVSKMANHHRFIATHPIAGTEHSGPNAALEGLFHGKLNIICKNETSDKDALALVETVYQALGMRTIYMTSDDHDRHLAYVSHLSHISSFMLGLTVLDIEQDEKSIFDLAGSGFASTVRLAKSSPNMWAPVFEQNKQHLSLALEEYIKHLSAFKKLVDTGDVAGTYTLMEKANDIRRVLKE